MIGYLYILGTLFFTIYGQLIIKWRIVKYGVLPGLFLAKITFLFKVLMDPFILSGFLSAFIASLFWMAAMTRFEISYAYPFMSFAFVMVLILSAVFFGETINAKKIVGLALIVAGIIVSSRS